MTTEVPAHHFSETQNRAVNPQSVSIEASDVFLNCDFVLSPIGSTIQKINTELNYLNLGWMGVKDAQVSREKQNEIIEEVVCKFSDIAGSIGLDPDEPDLSLLPNVIREYKDVIAAREKELGARSY